MLPFGSCPATHETQIYVLEDTKIPGDVLKGLMSLSSHGEIMRNPFLRSNRHLQAKIEEDFRKSVILAVDEELTKRVAESQEYDKLPIKDRDKVTKDQQKFAALAQGIQICTRKTLSRGRSLGNASETANAMFQLGRQCAPGAISPSAVNSRSFYIYYRVIGNVDEVETLDGIYSPSRK